MGWTRQRLEDVARTRLGDSRLIVVANREPYIHRRKSNEIEWIRPAGGLTTALDPVMRACGGVWVAHGSGDADRETADSKGRVAVPPNDPSYSLRRVWLTPEQESGYYYGFSNNALWPLCHQVYQRPVFDPSDWEQYRTVNKLFAEAVLEEAQGGPALIFVQDYHFALLPQLLKQARPDLTVVQFWHIPWPNPETFRVCPYAAEILEGMLGNDLLAFHIQYHCNNFLETIDRSIESRICREKFSVIRGGQTTRVQPFPISVDPDQASQFLDKDNGVTGVNLRHRYQLGNRALLCGVDRVDYTKGIVERLVAVERLIVNHPELVGRFHFVQMGAPSRTNLATYRRLNEDIHSVADHINRVYGRANWKPIVFINEHCGPKEIFALYRDSAGCVVTSLHDGMNLVAKEYVSARGDESGVLVLSRFTGAARELTDAVLVNPYDVDETAEGLYSALTMLPEEQTRRMRRMRNVVSDHNIYRWAGMLLSEAGKLVSEREDYDAGDNLGGVPSSVPIPSHKFPNLNHERNLLTHPA